MDLLERFFKLIVTKDIKDTTLLAVSGGVDSVVMAHLFHLVKLPFAIAHCNFQLRGSESDADELFVQALANRFQVQFWAKRFDTKEYGHQNGLSTQMAARELRYAWFSELTEAHGLAQIATAHHLNDSVETTLLNFIRGTGLSGLRGIRNKEAGMRKPLLRPLLPFSRSEIEVFAHEYKITWREDQSNKTDDYARNFVRHEIVPRMEALNPNFLHTAARNMTRLGEANDNLQFLLLNFLGLSSFDIRNETGVALAKEKLLLLPHSVQALRHILKPYGFDQEQARQVSENLTETGFELRSDAGYRILVDREKVVVTSISDQVFQDGNSLISIQADDLMVSLPDGSRILLMSADPAPPYPDGIEAVLLDAEKIQFPLHLRPWLPGDAFQPIGMRGQSQKLQDFFTNQKLSRLEKEQVWLLLNGDRQIIWVIGWRLDDRFKIHTHTNKALKIHWIK